MTDIAWGDPISKGSFVWPGPGKPVWLGNGERLQWRQFLSDWHYYVAGEMWHDGDYIRLPADHFAYTVIRWNAEHPDKAPFFPWGGGDEAPEDWDGGHALARNREIGRFTSWTHPWIGRGDVTPYDIIGYRRVTSASTPVEVLEDAAEAVLALVTQMVARSAMDRRDYDEARRIAALPSFPKAVDPLLLEAREQEAKACAERALYIRAKAVRAGELDDDGPIRCRLEGIRRGIELAKEQQ